MIPAITKPIKGLKQYVDLIFYTVHSKIAYLLFNRFSDPYKNSKVFLFLNRLNNRNVCKTYIRNTLKHEINASSTTALIDSI